MPAVRTLLRLFDLDETDGRITALDSYGANTHVGTSCGQLIRLSISSAPSPRSQTAASVSAPTREASSLSVEAPLGEAGGGALLDTPFPEQSTIFTTVARRRAISASGAAVQQLQHSRSQRLLFVLCGGRLQLLHADTYAVLSTIEADVACFSVASPLPAAGTGANGSVSSDTSVAPVTSALLTHTRVRTGRLAVRDDEGVSQHSRTSSHLRTPSEGSHGNFTMRTPQSAPAITLAASPLGSTISNSGDLLQCHGNVHHHSRDGKGGASSLLTMPPSSSGDKAHVVCIAEKQRRELAVYVVDRVSTSASSAESGAWPSESELAEDGSLSGSATLSATLSATTARSAPLPPRVVLLQRYVLPEPAQCVLMCNPAPVMCHGLAFPFTAAVGGFTGDGLPPLAGSVEAGLSVCVGMRHEVSLLSLLGGSPWCVLRLDGSCPPLLSIGSENNTLLVRTQAPNTVMEVGVPPVAAMAGCVQDANTGWRTGAAAATAAAEASPLLLRAGLARGAVAASAAASGAVLRGKDDELVMGDVFQADTAVELVLSRFPHVFLFTAHHCDVFSLLEDGAGRGATSRCQRVPLPGIRYGALRGQGMSVCVASDRTVWMLQLNPLRVQLAEMVTGGNSEGAFQLLAFHRRRATATRCNAAAAVDANDALHTIESDLHRMAGFAALHRGDVVEAIRYLREYVDPREVLLALPDCIPPTARAPVTPSVGSGASVPQTGVDVYVLDHIVTTSSEDVYDELLRQSAVADCVKASAAQDTIAPSPSSYWDCWHGPCVYNSFAGNVAEAWRAAFPAVPSSSSTSTGTVEDFVASRFVLLKTEVREWFAEELLEPVSCCSTVRSSVAAPTAGTRITTDQVGMECAGPPLPVPTTTTSLQLQRALVAAHRRAMEYASLVLAWEARDYRMAHQVVASVSQALRVEDCADMLRHLREFRLLAVLQFRVGQGEACLATLRSAVSVSAVLQLRYGHAAAQKSPIASQLSHWRQRMVMKMGQGRCNDVAAPQPTCGCGLLMLPSFAAVARVARTLFGVESPFDPANGDFATEALLGKIVSYYAARHSHVASAGAAVAAHDKADYCELQLSMRGTGSPRRLSFPHAGPLLSTVVEATVSASIPSHTAAQSQQEAATEPGPTAACHPAVRVVPSALTEFFYLVEKLDVVGVKQLLSCQPRLAQLRDEEGDTALHVTMSQLALVCPARTCDTHPSHSQSPALAAVQMPLLQLLCALNGLLVHFGCPVGLLNHYGWSCLDVAAVACAGNTTAFDMVTAALLAAVEVRAAS